MDRDHANMKAAQGKFSKRIACEFCNRIFDNDSDYNHHLRVVHQIDAWE